MATRYRVTLTVEEWDKLPALTRVATKTTGKRFLYARALLLCDCGPGGDCVNGSQEADEDRAGAQDAVLWAGAHDASAPVSPAFGTDSAPNVGSNCR